MKIEILASLVCLNFKVSFNWQILAYDFSDMYTHVQISQMI